MNTRQDYDITEPCGCRRFKKTGGKKGPTVEGRSSCEEHTLQFFDATGSGWIRELLTKKKKALRGKRE